MNGKWYGFDISYVYSLWQDFSMDTKTFDLVTLTLEIDLLLKNSCFTIMDANRGIYVSQTHFFNLYIRKDLDLKFQMKAIIYTWKDVERDIHIL